MATARPCSRCARFDKFEVDLAAGELRKSGERVPLQDQPFQILRLLLNPLRKSSAASGSAPSFGLPIRLSISISRSTLPSVNCAKH